MLLNPRKVKYRKAQKGKIRGIATTGAQMNFGEFGLKAVENGLIKSAHIEASRVVIARKLKGAGKLWINIFPHKPVTKKPATAAKQTAKKTTAVKAVSTTKPKTKAATTAKEKKAKTDATKTQLSTVSTTARNPVHTGVLAAIGVFALLYGAYEYRHDMANKIHQFRGNRAARRAARQAAARR